MTLLFWMFAAHAQPAPVAEPGEEPSSALLAREGELLELVERQDPELHRKLLALRATDRIAYAARLYRVARLAEKAQGDPAFAQRLAAIGQTEQQLRVLAAGFGALSPTEQVTRRAEIERLAVELMDLKQAERRARVEELRARLAEIEAEIAEREAGRDAIVRRYVDQLLAEDVDL